MSTRAHEPVPSLPAFLITLLLGALLLLPAPVQAQQKRPRSLQELSKQSGVPLKVLEAVQAERLLDADVYQRRAFLKEHAEKPRESLLPLICWLAEGNDPDWPIYTHPRYLPGARLDGVTFTRSVLAEGSRMIDSTIEDSIIGMRTLVRRATVRRSLVRGADAYPPAAPAGAPPLGIGENSVIEGAIVDKNARIGRDVRIVAQEDRREGEGPGWVIRDGIVVVPKNAIVPDGTVV